MKNCIRKDLSKVLDKAVAASDNYEEMAYVVAFTIQLRHHLHQDGKTLQSSPRVGGVQPNRFVIILNY